MGKVVLVTGVARQLGARFAERIRREPGVDLVVGVDVLPSDLAAEPAPADAPLAPYVFSRVDLRRPAIAQVLAEHAVDTVVHLNVSGTNPSAVGRATVKEINVIGSMQLLAACQQSALVRRLAVKSTTAVYGATSRDPAVFAERTQPKTLPTGGFAKDAAEVEGYVRSFARRRPDVAVTVLRFANLVGPGADTPLAEYFTLPVLPTVLGRDPRLQFVHMDDAVEVLRLAALEPAPGSPDQPVDRRGTFNVAGDGVLLLTQCARRLGRPTLPMLRPALGWAAALARQARLVDFAPEQLELLTHGRVVDTTALHEVFGYRPAFSTPEAFADFVAGRPQGPLPPERLAGLADRLGGLLTRDRLVDDRS
ncbi:MULTISPECIES: NAD-dependent epimerase/dehydratase family protein [Kitasatospora]|uniref:NAD-dependent epimerase/dehydratase family protein n=1 Tax=Kitasatospora TaxID=2063 RepID=UPI000C714BBF|nr:NAD-dependent epimerase/dehydratase family protein [Kitasatospora sp. GP30]MDH6138647.1 UDP-glucose 4-epimerase [Kitasatospora sp. GP30]